MISYAGQPKLYTGDHYEEDACRATVSHFVGCLAVCGVVLPIAFLAGLITMGGYNECRRNQLATSSRRRILAF